MIERTLFQPDHQAFADSFRRFIDKEVTPHHAAWEDQGYVAREVWSQAGANGFLCMSLPEEYGGAGADKLYSVAQMEELARAGTTGIGFGLHSEIVAPYILHYGTEEQKKRWLPRLATGVGGLAWDDVKPLITQYLGDLAVPVIVYSTYRKDVQADEGL